MRLPPAWQAPPPTTTVASLTADETAAQPFHSKFPYLRFIDETKNLDISNYNGLQVTLTQRSYHGLYFLAGYTYSHALDDLSALGSDHYQAAKRRATWAGIWE